MPLLKWKFKIDKNFYFLCLTFFIIGFPGGAAINLNIKYVISISLLIIIILTNKDFINRTSTIKGSSIYLRNIYDISIFLYIGGIIIGSLITTKNLSSSLIYSFLFLLRHLTIKSLCNKVDLIKILDAIVIGFTSSTIFGLIFNRSAQILFLKVIKLQLGGIASNRISLWGATPNALGVGIGICCCYMITRILIEQYNLCELDIKKKGYFQYNSLSGYLLLLFNLIVLFLCNTRSAYLCLLFGNLPIVIRIFLFNLHKSNKYNKYYILFFIPVLINFESAYLFFSKFILLQQDRYRGFSTGLTGRFDLWQNKIEILGPLGYGYSREIFDNNFLYSAYLSGFLFSLPIYIFYFFACIKYISGFYRSEKNIINNFEYSLKAPLSIYCIIMFFLEQQTIGMTSVLGYFFNLIPCGIVSKNLKEN